MFRAFQCEKTRKAGWLDVSFTRTTASEREPENPPSFQQKADTQDIADKPGFQRLYN